MAYFAYSGHHVLVLLPTQQLPHAELQLLEQVFVGWEPDGGAQPGQHVAQLIPAGRRDSELQEQLGGRLGEQIHSCTDMVSPRLQLHNSVSRTPEQQFYHKF